MFYLILNFDFPFFVPSPFIVLLTNKKSLQTLSCQLLFQGLTKRIGGGMHEWAAKVDEYARGFIGPPGSTLFEELGLYYIGPVDGHNIEDLICVLNEVAALDFMGPVLVHVITKEVEEQMPDRSTEIPDAHEKGICHQLVDSSSNIYLLIPFLFFFDRFW